MSQPALTIESTILMPMTKDEARKCINGIKNHISEARELLYDLHIRDGWKALGYSSWGACLDGEFTGSRAYLYQLYDAEKVQRNILSDPSLLSAVADNNDERVIIPEFQLRPLTHLEPDDQREVWRLAQETAPKNEDGTPRLTGAHVQETVKQWEQPRQPISRFNRTNENIEWAAWSWNPVTGCKHGCPYCYARDIANRFYPQGFEPTFHPDRLEAPQHTPMIEPRWTEPEPDRGYKGVFVCSMADLFGSWVPQEWIDAVLASVQQAPQWTFIFLTKNPSRLAGCKFPANAWVGTTIDRQARVKAAEDAFEYVDAAQLFVSCEPMLERLTFSRLDLFDWVLFGGQSRSSQQPESQPQWEWVEYLLTQARQAQCAVYWKDNLRVRPREYPT